MQPPCNCKPTNVNNFAPAKSPYVREPSLGLEGNQLRPPRLYSLMISVANVFRREAPQWSLTWRDNSVKANVKSLGTPRKKLVKQ